MADREEAIDAIVRDLRARGHRVTPQRVAVVRELLGRTDHPSAEVLHQAVLPQYPMMAISTVYSTIRLLVELGVAAEVSPGVSEARYDPNTSNHCHLVCTRCGAIADIEPDLDLPSVGDCARAVATDYRVVRLTLNLYGTCRACAAAE